MQDKVTKYGLQQALSCLGILQAGLLMLRLADKSVINDEKC